MRKIIFIIVLLVLTTKLVAQENAKQVETVPTMVKQQVIDVTLHDPTRPPDAIAKTFVSNTTSIYELTMIIRSKDHSTALINGQYVTVGDKLGRDTVIAINANDVVLQTTSGKEVLPLSVDYKQALKKTQN